MTKSQSVRLRGFSGYHHVQAEVKGAAKPIVSHFMQQSVKVGGGGVPLGRHPNAGGGTTASQADNQATSKVRGVGAHR